MLITSILLVIFLMLLGLLGLGIYFKRRYKISLALLGAGALAFLVSTQLFERLLHVLVLRPDTTGSSYLLRDFPLLYVLYAVFSAAIFEEGARYFVLALCQRKRPLEFRDALSYGLGHGGIEMIVVGLLSLVNLFFLYQAVLEHPSQIANLLPEAAVNSIRNTPVWVPYMLLLERFLALFGQILLTIWVWKALKTKHFRFFLGALGFHILLDLAPAMNQAGFLSSPLLVEVLVLLVLLLLTYCTKKQCFK